MDKFYVTTNYRNEWNVYLTKTDSQIQTFTTGKDVAKFLAKEEIEERGELYAIKILMTFPNNININGRREIMAPNKKWKDFESMIIHIDKLEEFKKAIDDKLAELLSDI